MVDRQDFVIVLANFLGLNEIVYFIILAVSATASYVLVRFVVRRIVTEAIERSRAEWDDKLANRGVFRHLSLMAPALILYFGVGYYPTISSVARQVILAYLVINIIIILDRLLSAGLDIYRLYPVSKKRPIKGYVQLCKLVLYIVGAVATISVLLDKSPLGILGGIGAITAILILVFRNTILSLIASVQLAADGLLHRGDWIEIPECGIDGEVVDIMLHTVKVRNWDNTIVTVPTYKLIDGSFKNWRQMREVKGRRVKRSILIDQTSVRFCDDKMMEKFRQIKRLKPYLVMKEVELEKEYSSARIRSDDGLSINHRTLTNLGTFRAYVVAYLNENIKLRDDMTVMVRQLPPSPTGLPLEVYVFSSDTDLVEFEGVQADIFDHLIAALPYFDLRVFQHPSGYDFRTLTESGETDDTTEPGSSDVLDDGAGMVTR